MAATNWVGAARCQRRARHLDSQPQRSVVRGLPSSTGRAGMPPDDALVRDLCDRDHGVYEWLPSRHDRERRHLCLARSLTYADQPLREHVQHHSAGGRIVINILSERQEDLSRPAAPPVCASSPRDKRRAIHFRHARAQSLPARAGDRLRRPASSSSALSSISQSAFGPRGCTSAAATAS